MREMKKYITKKRHCEERMMDLKSAHYQACRKMGWTDDEIEKDWERVVQELGDIIDERRSKEVKEDEKPDLSVFDNKKPKAVKV